MTITTERLNDYTEIVKELDYLLKQKEKIKERISILKSPNFEEPKVTTGGKKKRK